MAAKQPQSDVGVNVPHTTGVAAEVNAPAEVVLYDREGRALRVGSADVDHFLRLGFRRELVDPTTTAKELKALFRAAHEAIDTYVAGVLQDEEIDTDDTAAHATAVAAVEEALQAWGRLEAEIAARYPVRQGEPVTMTNADGGTTQVDPGQVKLYREHGWKEST